MANFFDAVASLGRGKDNRLAHVGPDEVVVPKEIFQAQPQLLGQIQQGFNKFNEMTGKAANVMDFVVGRGKMNPNTGLEEFGIFDDDSGFESALGGRSRERSREAFSGDRGRDIQSRMSESIGNPGGFSDVYQDPRPQTLGPVPQSRAAVDVVTDPGASTAERIGAGGNVALTGAALNAVFPGLGFLAPLAGKLGLRGDPGEQGQQAIFAGVREGDERLSPAEREAVQEGLNRLIRPPLPDPLPIFNFAAGMSPLQQRTAFATRAVGGDSRFTSPEAREFYNNLIRNTLITDQGGTLPLSNLTPIENQFIQQVLGVTPQSNTRNLLNAIANA